MNLFDLIDKDSLSSSFIFLVRLVEVGLKIIRSVLWHEWYWHTSKP